MKPVFSICGISDLKDIFSSPKEFKTSKEFNLFYNRLDAMYQDSLRCLISNLIRADGYEYYGIGGVNYLSFSLDKNKPNPDDIFCELSFKYHDKEFNYLVVIDNQKLDVYSYLKNCLSYELSKIDIL